MKLKELGANENQGTTATNNSPLMLAAKNNHLEMASYLISTDYYLDE